MRTSRVFRIFVSSTFDDLREERDVLQRDVFPRLVRLCAKHGCQFQAIDLRWGVSEESALDQQTMNICLAEFGLLPRGDTPAELPNPARRPLRLDPPAAAGRSRRVRSCPFGIPRRGAHRRVGTVATRTPCPPSTGFARDEWPCRKRRIGPMARNGGVTAGHLASRRRRPWLADRRPPPSQVPVLGDPSGDPPRRPWRAERSGRGLRVLSEHRRPIQAHI